MESAIDKLTDFKPIQRLQLPDLGELNCAGLIIIVGPNSSGKSQLLRDINEKISGRPRELVVAETLELTPVEYKELLKSLIAEGYVSKSWDNEDKEQYIPMTTAIGTGQGSQNVGDHQLTQWQQEKQKSSRWRATQLDNYRNWFSRYLVTALFLENRLTSMAATKTIDFDSQPPTHDLHALHIRDDARDALTEEIKRAFSKAIWSDVTRGNQLSLKIGEKGDFPSATDRHSVKKMAKYRTLESEGDGMKSYVSTVISLLLGRRPVSVIDEPEMCLHPPQAYNLGQFIGSTGTSKQTATFVATHSSQVLRGVLQTADELQIVRLTRQQGGFSAKLLSSQMLTEAMRKPTVRAESVLDGIFAQAVAVIEADGDRIVYQAAWEVVGQSQNFDIHFSAVGGTGGIADTCKLYKMLGIPVAVIADLDILTDRAKTKQILGILCDDTSLAEKLVREVSEVSEVIKTLPPTISVEKVRSELKEIIEMELDWSEGHDQDLRSSLSRISGELNGMRAIKRGGVTELPSELSSRAGDLVEALGKEGLFLVPVGELEFWLSGAGISASKNKKWAWANEAAEFIRTRPVQEGDIWEFMQSVGDYLTGTLGSALKIEDSDI